MSKYVSVLLISYVSFVTCFKITNPAITVFKPRGLMMTLPDQEGIELVVFHVNVNREIKTEEGDYTKYILRPIVGQWIYENRVIRLTKGDAVYYRLFVKKGGLGYIYNNKYFVDKDADELSSTTTSRTTSTIRSTNKPAFPLPTATLPTFPPQHELTPMQPVNDCTNLIVNITNSLFTMEEQVKTLKKENAILRELADKGKYFLRLIGRIAETGDPIDTVNFVLKEKLDIEDKVKSALKIENHNSIIFEVYTFEQKLNIIKKVKEKLKNSQQLAITYNL